MNPIDTKNFSLDSLGQGKTERVASDKLGQEQFLELMVAQLKNQDPMQPMQNGEFLSQMAQFGTVNGIQELQKSFGELSTAMQSNQALMASSLVGRVVLVPGSQMTFNGAQALGAAELPQAASDVRVTVLDGSNQVVRQFNLGEKPAGTVKFGWDGQTNAGGIAPAGVYTIKVEAVSGGKNSALSTYVGARVDSVSLGGSQGLTLNLWDGSTTSLSNVKEIG
jgi:flagellar basal-body rod modification protein FlgD